MKERVNKHNVPNEKLIEATLFLLGPCIVKAHLTVYLYK